MPFVQNGNVTLFVTEAGSTDAPAILFSNSLGTTHRMWDDVVDELSARYRCIRYDTRGHGASTTAVTAFSVDDLADDAVRIMDVLQLEQVHFAGLSLGGLTGQALALRHPSRLRSLTLMATAAHFPPSQAWRDRAATVRAGGTGQILDATLARWFTSGCLTRRPPILDQVATEFGRIDPDGYARCCEAIADADLRSALSRIEVPTLILAGAQDPATPVAMSEILRDGISRSRLMVLDPAAHLLASEQPFTTAQHLAQHVDDVEQCVFRGHA